MLSGSKVSVYIVILDAKAKKGLPYKQLGVIKMDTLGVPKIYDHMAVFLL